MVQVIARQRADAVRPEELVLVEQVAEYALELPPVEDREQPAPGVADEPASRRSHLAMTSRDSDPGTSSTIADQPGRRSQTSASNIVDAQSGSSPTIDRTFRRVARPSGSRSTS